MSGRPFFDDCFRNLPALLAKQVCRQFYTKRCQRVSKVGVIKGPLKRLISILLWVFDDRTFFMETQAANNHTRQQNSEQNQQNHIHGDACRPRAPTRTRATPGGQGYVTRRRPQAPYPLQATSRTTRQLDAGDLPAVGLSKNLTCSRNPAGRKALCQGCSRCTQTWAQQLKPMPSARLLSAHGAGGERLTRATRRPRACSLPPRAKAKAEAVPTVSRAQHVVIRGGRWMEMARMTRAEQEQVRGRPSRERHGDGLNTWLQHGTLARRKALCSVTE